MKLPLLRLLACPECSAELELDVFLQEGEEVEAGQLRCVACHRRFPIINAIPRMLPDALMGTLQQYHPDFFAQYAFSLPEQTHEDVVARTLAFFTRQRPELYKTQIQPASQDYLRRNLELRIPEVRSFAGRLGLDAGCGDGRYTQCIANYGAEVVGLDLGNSVDYARRRTRDNPKVHIVQGSILQPPFKPETFEFITSIGVLHHLPDPRQGFEALVPLLEPGGAIHIWVYGLENMSFFYRASHLTPLRRFTRRLPPAASYVASVPIALALEAGIFLPVRLAHRVRPGGMAIPPQLTEVAALPFSAKVAEVHDRIGAPVTHFLSDAELQDWYTGCGLEDVAITPTPGGRGWTARGSAIRSAAAVSEQLDTNSPE